MAADDFGKPSIAFRLAVLAAVLLLLIVLPVASLLWMTSVPGRSHAGPLPPLDPAERELALRLQRHVRAIAARPHNTAHWRDLEGAAVYVESSLAELGYRVYRQRFDAGGIEVRNIEAVISPAGAGARTLVIGAHYDSWFAAPGANDNATGTAAVLELARLLADLNGRSSLRIRLVLFVNEEPPWFKTGQMGSLVYARRLRASGEPLFGMMSLETLGYYSGRTGSQHYPLPLGLLYPTRGDFVAFVGLTSSRDFVRGTVGAFRRTAQFPSEGGAAPAFIGGVDWSDHWAFEEIGAPALMVTDTAPYRYPWYHSAQDTAEKVDYARLARVVAGLERVVRGWAQPPPLANRGAAR